MVTKKILTEHRSFEINIGDENEVNIVLGECDCKWVMCKDTNYGADADGHRGVEMVCVDDLEITNLVIDDKPVNEIGDKLHDQISDILDTPKDNAVEG